MRFTGFNRRRDGSLHCDKCGQRVAVGDGGDIKDDLEQSLTGGHQCPSMPGEEGRLRAVIEKLCEAVEDQLAFIDGHKASLTMGELAAAIAKARAELEGEGSDER